MSGKVILVGAGPGDPGLLTLRGREALRDAEVVLFDRLVGEGVLDLIPEEAQRIDVGKSSGRHLIPQEEINALILDHVRRGKRVVRLKGGDPYLFGRGAEELEAVAAEGFPFEVVPGVTSAVAVPAYGGIPVSHREMASSIHILTGHPRHGADPAINYKSLAALGGTLIFLMGVGALEEISTGLTGAGLPGTTPCALIENGTRPGQRRLVTTIAEIADRAREEAFRPPSVLVVGEVCTLAEELDWFSRRPLHGVNVLVTRPKASAGTLSAKLRALGAGVTEYPCIRTEPLPVEGELFNSLGAWNWLVFTSPVGAGLFFENMAARRLDIRALAGVKLAAVGAKTAAELTGRGLMPELVPDTYDGAHLAAELLKKAEKGERVLLYRAKAGAPELADTLRAGGLLVDDVAAYDTLCECPETDRVRKSLAEGKIKYATFTSASTVEGFAQSSALPLPGADYSTFTGVCIGEETAKAARAYGIRVIVSKEATVDSLVDCILSEEENHGA